MKQQMNKFLLGAMLTLCSIVTFAQSTSKVIVYRKGSIYGGFAKFKVIIDGKEMNILKGNSTYAYDLAPGAHTISPKQSRRAITLNTEAGKTYVVKYRTMLGLFGARPRLKVLTLDEAKEDAKVIRNKYK